MSLPIVLIGAEGRMSKILQEVCTEESRSFRFFHESKTGKSFVQDFRETRGVIDFSIASLALAEKIGELARTAGVPWISGTTGWGSESDEFHKLLRRCSLNIPVIWDSNFSVGIEILSAISSDTTQKLRSSPSIVDIHHITKKDAPSGTALKIRERILEVYPTAKIDIESIRQGDVPGEHRVVFNLGNETLEFVHQAMNRRPFAEGALKALDWASERRSGLYSMRDILGS